MVKIKTKKKVKTFFGKTAFAVDDKIRAAGYTPYKNTYRKLRWQPSLVRMKGFKLSFKRMK
jgi:hypothetical protein